jgi:hypothetical protein
MLLAYVDESYNKDRYWIAALVCPEYEVVPLTADLDAVVEKAARSYQGIDLRAELHGYALFHAEDDWAPLTGMARARIGVYNDAFDAIAGRNVDIIVRGVHVPRLNQRYVYPDHPHAVVLSHLLERVDERAAALGQLVLVIADEIDQADTYRRNLWHFQRYSTGGWRSRQLTRIVDTIHFAPSEASRLVQAADLIAYLNFRIIANVDTDPRAVRANEALWQRIAGRVYHRHCWWP